MWWYAPCESGSATTFNHKINQPHYLPLLLEQSFTWSLHPAQYDADYLPKPCSPATSNIVAIRLTRNSLYSYHHESVPIRHNVWNCIVKYNCFAARARLVVHGAIRYLVTNMRSFLAASILVWSAGASLTSAGVWSRDFNASALQELPGCAVRSLIPSKRAYN